MTTNNLTEINNKLRKLINVNKLKRILELQLQDDTLVNFSKKLFANYTFADLFSGTSVSERNPAINYVYPIFFLISEEYFSIEEINSIDFSIEDERTNLITIVENILNNKNGLIIEKISLCDMLSNIRVNDVLYKNGSYNESNLNSELERIFDDTAEECGLSNNTNLQVFFGIKKIKNENIGFTNFVNLNGKPAKIIEKDIFKYSRLLNNVSQTVISKSVSLDDLQYSTFFQKFLENISTRTINY